MANFIALLLSLEFQVKKRSLRNDGKIRVYLDWIFPFIIITWSMCVIDSIEQTFEFSWLLILQKSKWCMAQLAQLAHDWRNKDLNLVLFPLFFKLIYDLSFLEDYKTKEGWFTVHQHLLKHYGPIWQGQVEDRPDRGVIVYALHLLPCFYAEQKK